MSNLNVINVGMSYTLKRRHLYIILVLIYFFSQERYILTFESLIFFSIIWMAVSDCLDGLIERYWHSDNYRVDKYGYNWWKGLWNQVYEEITK